MQTLSVIYQYIHSVAVLPECMGLQKINGLRKTLTKAWIFPYFIGHWVLSWFGPKVLGGAAGDIPFYLSMLLVAILAIIRMIWALKVTVPDGQVTDYFSAMDRDGIEL